MKVLTFFTIEAVKLRRNADRLQQLQKLEDMVNEGWEIVTCATIDTTLMIYTLMKEEKDEDK